MTLSTFLQYFWTVFARSDDSPVEVEFREYEWQDFRYCEICKHRWKHTFIEWIEPGEARVTTSECQVCGQEESL